MEETKRTAWPSLMADDQLTAHGAKTNAQGFSQPSVHALCTQHPVPRGMRIRPTTCVAATPRHPAFPEVGFLGRKTVRNMSLAAGPDGRQCRKLWWGERIGVFFFFPHCRLRALMKRWTLILFSLSHPQERKSHREPAKPETCHEWCRVSRK